MFIGRKQELELLNKTFEKKGSQLAVIYGRRRVGKSALIREFSKKKRCLKFEGLEGERTKEQIENFTYDLQKQIQDPILKNVKFDNWQSVFDYLTGHIQKSDQKLILFFDEFPWMSASQGRLVSLLKKVWDNDWKPSGKVVLILCGSVASFMIDKVLKSNAMYGRVNLEICLKGLTPSEVRQLFKKGVSSQEVFKYMLIFGGIPKYLEEINPKQSFEQNIENLFFHSQALFLNEYDKVFYSQFREHQTYEKIALFLNQGPKTLKEIASHLKMPSGGGLKSYLENLEKALFISSYVPYDKNDNSKLKKYKLTDEYLRFYFKFIFPNKKTITSQAVSRKLFNQIVKEKWTSWLGFAFENFCLKHAAFLADKLGFRDQLKSYGPMFSRVDKGFQIDLLFNRFDNRVVLCEMKYYSQKVPASVIPEVEKKLALLDLPDGYSCQTVLVSQLGPDKALQASDYFDDFLNIEDILS